MKICKVCKIENADQFIYCKNCGAHLEVTPPPAPVVPAVEIEIPAAEVNNAEVPVSPVAPVTPVAPVIPAAPVTPVAPAAPANPYAGIQSNPYVAPAAPVAPAPSAPASPAGLVPVEMVLPDPLNPEYRSTQTVYVTPAQKAAIQYDIIKRSRKI